MNKFKVGDKVRVINNTIYHGFKHGDVITVEKVIDSPLTPLFESSGYYMLECDVEELGPVRTIARKEVVPGQYGIVSVTNKGKIIIQPAVYTHEQLREAAHILNQIAEAWEDGAK